MSSTVFADSEAMSHCEGQVGYIIHHDAKKICNSLWRTSRSQTPCSVFVCMSDIPGYCGIGTKKEGLVPLDRFLCYVGVQLCDVFAHVGRYTERVHCWAVTQQKEKITVRRFNLLDLRQSQNSMSLQQIILGSILSLVLKDKPVLVSSYKLHIHTLQVTKAWKIVVAFPVEAISWYWTTLSRWLKIHLLRWHVVYQLQALKTAAVFGASMLATAFALVTPAAHLFLRDGYEHCFLC